MATDSTRDTTILERFLESGTTDESEVFRTLTRISMRRFKPPPPALGGRAVFELAAVGRASFHEIAFEPVDGNRWEVATSRSDHERCVSTRWQSLEDWAAVELGRMHLATAVGARRVIITGDDSLWAELLRTMATPPAEEGTSFLQVVGSVWSGEQTWSDIASTALGLDLFDEVIGHMGAIAELRQLSDFGAARMMIVVPMPSGFGADKLVGRLDLSVGSASTERCVKNLLSALGPLEIALELNSLDHFLSMVPSLTTSLGTAPDPLDLILKGKLRVHGEKELLPVIAAAFELM